VDIGTVRPDSSGMTSSADSAPRTRGRKPDADSTSGKIRALLAKGTAVADIAKELKCSASLIYNVKARMAGGGKKAKRSPGRPRKSQGPAGAADGLSGIIALVQKNEGERARLHKALTKLADIVREALA